MTLVEQATHALQQVRDVESMLADEADPELVSVSGNTWELGNIR